MLRQRLHEADFIDGDAFDAERLRRQADALEERATALRAEARALGQEAIDLRVEADRLTRAPLTILGAPPAKPESTEFLERVVGVLEGVGPVAMRDLTEHLNATPARVRSALARLEELGTIRKTGIKRGTRYELTSEDDDTEEAAKTPVRSYEGVVRDAAIELDTFEFVDLQRALPDLSEATLRRWVRTLEDKGVFTAERVGNAKVYAYVPPEADGTKRRRYEAPEKEATRLAGPVHVRGDAVAGTGKGTRSGSSIVNELIREVRPFGITVEKTKHTVSFVRDGVVIANASSTPGASSLKQTRSELRKAGVPV